MTKLDFKNLIREACSGVGINSDVDSIIDNWKQEKTLPERWYDSLKKDSPDYSIYEDLLYIGEAFWCWYNFSKKSIELLGKPTKIMPISLVNQIGDVSYVVDAGCGLGLTTMMIKSLFPNSNVLGTNVKDSFQWKIAQFLGDRFDFKMTDSFQPITGDCIVLALEYFEHFVEPLTELERFLALNPLYIICANTFTGDPSPGHFNRYSVGGRILSGRETSLEFNKKMKQFGYQQVKTGYWNNRPAVWGKKFQNSLDQFL